MIGTQPRIGLRTAGLFRRLLSLLGLFLHQALDLGDGDAVVVAQNQGVLREWAVFVLHTNLLAARVKAEQIRRGEEQQRIGGFSVAPRSA